MKLDKEKSAKLVIVAVVTIAALAVMGILVQLIQTILPFLIIGLGVYAGYRWAMSDAPAPSADEVEEGARDLFSRFRRTKKAVETTVKAGEALNELTAQPRRRRHRRQAQAAVIEAQAAPAAEKQPEAAEVNSAPPSEQQGAIEFKDAEVLISAADFEQPDISRLEEKEKEAEAEEPEVTNNVLAQIEERRRRLNSGG